MFENLPDKIKKLYQEKIKEEDARQKQSGDAAGSDESKWKMKFSKTEGDAKSKKTNFSLYDSDDEDQQRNFQAHAPSQSVTAALNAYGNLASSSASKAAAEMPEMAPAPIILNQGPIVLDKFGNFRRVEQPALPVPPQEMRRSRSKGRRSRSRSSSRYFLHLSAVNLNLLIKFLGHQDVAEDARHARDLIREVQVEVDEVASEEDLTFHEVDSDDGIMTIGIIEIHGITEDKIDRKDLIDVVVEEAHEVVVEQDLGSLIEVFHAVSHYHLSAVEIERIKWMMPIEEVAREARTSMLQSGRN